MFSFKRVILIFYFFSLFAANHVLANTKQAPNKKQYQFKNKQVSVKLNLRSPQQIAAFYEGRGFSKKMIAKLKSRCFITVSIHNKTKNILWHTLKNWKYTSSQGELQAFDRTYWKTLWNKMNIPLAHQSTFRWTLLPESLDFRANEHEGGNIILPYSNKAFSLEAIFKTKKNKSGKPIVVKIENIQCLR